MADIFKEHLPRLESPLSAAETVTGSYSTDGYVFNQTPRGINCSEAGTLIVTMIQGEATSSIYVVGGLNPYRITAIHSGSSAGNIVGMY